MSHGSLHTTIYKKWDKSGIQWEEKLGCLCQHDMSIVIFLHCHTKYSQLMCCWYWRKRRDLHAMGFLFFIAFKNDANSECVLVFPLQRKYLSMHSHYSFCLLTLSTTTMNLPYRFMNISQWFYVLQGVLLHFFLVFFFVRHISLLVSLIRSYLHDPFEAEMIGRIRHIFTLN